MKDSGGVLYAWQLEKSVGVVDTSTKEFSKIAAPDIKGYAFAGAATVGTLVYFAPNVRRRPPRAMPMPMPTMQHARRVSCTVQRALAVRTCHKRGGTRSR